MWLQNYKVRQVWDFTTL